ncbi:NACHT, LRR and PYD domains-containing protein 12 [Pungitius pungitius]|uniref:NACHT, LRR and PYD domains-containing protein 12 n=1 Tax=Pungitius pungitius TaxID=134920 RepID=UPI002E14542E
MDKDSMLTHMLQSDAPAPLLGGQSPVAVINGSNHVSPLTSGGPDGERLPLDSAVRTALSEGTRTVVLGGPEGSGKTTALQKLVVGWARGELLQNFSFVFHFRLGQLDSLGGTLSLEALLLRHHGHLPPGSLAPLLQDPEGVLFVFDDLDQWRHSLDPSVLPPLCADPGEEAPASLLVAGLLHGSLLKGASFLVATRPAEGQKFPRDARLQVLGFLKPQRGAYVKGFFSADPSAATTARKHMERTLGFYDVCASPRFCWTVCSVYKSLMDAGAKLPETLTQLYVDILARLIQSLRLNEARSRALVSALGKMASHCLLQPHQSCTKEEMDSFGFHQGLASVGIFLRVDDGRSDGPVFSFHSRAMLEFTLATSFLLDTSTPVGVEELLEKHQGRVELLDVFLSGLSEPAQRRPLEAALGELDPGRIADFARWFRSSSEATLKGRRKDQHHRRFHLLLQTQNESLVKEIAGPLARTGIGYGDPSLRDCVALNYVFGCLGEMELLNLYRTRDLTEEQAEALAPAMSLCRKIELSDSSLNSAAVPHLASALRRGLTEELDLSHVRLGEEEFRSLCEGLRNCKLHVIKLLACELTEAVCGDLASALTSGTAQLREMDMRFNPIGDRGFVKLCKALQSPLCRLQELMLQKCELTAVSMEALSAALRSGGSELRRVDLTQNVIGERGIEALSESLQHPLCKLRGLVLFDCELSAACCPRLSEALMSDRCHLTELDLSLNDLGQEGALLLCHALRRPGCPIEKLSLSRCELTAPVFRELSSAMRGGTSRLKSLIVGLNAVGDEGVKPLWEAVAHPSCLLEELDVEMTGLTDECVRDLCAALRASGVLRSLELRNNSLTDASVPALVRAVQDSDSMQEMSLKYNDISEDVFDVMDECGKIRY